MLEDLLVFAAVGFAAQMVDGAIGMAYGLSATSVLLTLGFMRARLLRGPTRHRRRASVVDRKAQRRSNRAA